MKLLMMSAWNIRIFFRTTVLALFVLLPVGAEEMERELPELISQAFSKRAVLVIPIEERPALYQEFSKDENYSREFREYASKRYRLSVIRQSMIELIQSVHDQQSAESAVERILEYDKEVAGMDIRQAFIRAKRKANKMELYLLAHLYEWEGMDCANVYKKMVSCIEGKNLYQYDMLKRELNPRLLGLWNHSLYLPSFYVSTEPIIAAYKDIYGDSAYSAELREFAARCLKLNDIREKMLEAASKIHDEASAIEAGEILTRHVEEMVDLDMLGYYIEIKDKLSKGEQEKLDQLLLWRYDEAEAFMSRYLRIWEEKGLEQYASQVEIIRESVPFKTYRALWADYMYHGYNKSIKSGIKIEKSVDDLIFELSDRTYMEVLYPISL